ncbi:Putative ribonuclease H protein At1g65750 [Linum perenne]
MRAELRAAEIGLMITWDKGYKKVHLQLDSLAAITAILGHSEEDSRHGRTLDSIKELHTLHVIRDCKVAREVWSTLLPSGLDRNFFTDDLQSWLQHGLQHDEWGLSFSITIWILWKARNEATFENKLATCDQLRLRVLHWIVGVRETMTAHSQVISKGAKGHVEAHIGWRAGPSDYVTINTDGSVLQPHSQAAAGGILRTRRGHPVGSFAANLGRCSIMRAELRAADIGLMIAWDKGYKKVHLQLDSLAAITAILGHSEEDLRHGRTLDRIKELRMRDWDVTIAHTFREGNKVADLLSHHMHSLDFGFHINCTYTPLR